MAVNAQGFTVNAQGFPLDGQGVPYVSRLAPKNLRRLVTSCPLPDHSRPNSTNGPVGGLLVVWLYDPSPEPVDGVAVLSDLDLQLADQWVRKYNAAVFNVEHVPSVTG